MASDAYMEVETRQLIGETFDQKFGMKSDEARRQGAFEISSFTLGATSNRKDDYDPAPKPAATTTTPGTTPAPSQPASSTTGAASASQSQTTIKPFSIKKSIDNASSDLFQICCLQAPIDWAVISLREAGDTTRKPWLIIEFREVYVESFDWELDPNASGEDVRGQETITFSFKTILIKYCPQYHSGEHATSFTAKGWNRQTHLPNPIDDMGSERW